jgi:predicted nucleic acid-binding protein
LTSARIVYVEARAALAAAVRARRLGRGPAARSRGLLDVLVSELYVVELRPSLAALAGDVAEQYALRASDAVHLASAVSLGERDLVVASWDVDLRRAAGEAGLAVAP